MLQSLITHTNEHALWWGSLRIFWKARQVYSVYSLMMCRQKSRKCYLSFDTVKEKRLQINVKIDNISPFCYRFYDSVDDFETQNILTAQNLWTGHFWSFLNLYLKPEKTVSISTIWKSHPEELAESISSLNTYFYVLLCYTVELKS